GQSRRGRPRCLREGDNRRSGRAPPGSAPVRGHEPRRSRASDRASCSTALPTDGCSPCALMVIPEAAVRPVPARRCSLKGYDTSVFRGRTCVCQDCRMGKDILGSPRYKTSDQRITSVAAGKRRSQGTRAISMKFFVDTADVAEIKDLAATGLLDGVTTNPTL